METWPVLDLLIVAVVVVATVMVPASIVSAVLYLFERRDR